MTVIHLDFGVGVGTGACGMGHSDAFACHFQNLLDSIGPEKLYRYNDKLSFDVMLSFDFFLFFFLFQSFSMISLLLFIYLKEELKTLLKQVTS